MPSLTPQGRKDPANRQIPSDRRVGRPDPDPDQQFANDNDLDAIVDAVVSVANQRRSVLERLREALLKDDNGGAIVLARQLVGLPEGLT